MDSMQKTGKKHIIQAALCIIGAFLWMGYSVYKQNNNAPALSVADLESGKRIAYQVAKLEPHWLMYDRAALGKRYLFVPILSDQAYQKNPNAVASLVAVIDANDADEHQEYVPVKHEKAIGKYSSLGVAESDYRHATKVAAAYAPKVYAFRPQASSIGFSELEMGDWLPAAISLWVGLMFLWSGRSNREE